MNRWSRREVLGLGGLVAGGVLLGGAPAAWASPSRKFTITDFGAVDDGVTDCTDAFRAAIAACQRAGGGRVVVPPGEFLTGPIHLRSNMNLHVTGTIRYHTDPAKYLPVVMTRWEGTECYNYSPFVYAFGQRNVSITGSGTLDGQGRLGPWESWYANSGPQGADQRELRRMGEEGVPVEQRVFGAGHFLRPKMIQFYRCQNVLVDGVTVIDPPMWTIHPVLCRNVVVRNVTVHSFLHNTDGCDPEASTNVYIADCRFNTNDDCIAIKAGRDADGHRVGVPSSNILVERCKFAGRWGGITIGSEMSGGVRHVYARDCEINPPDFPGNFPVKYPLYIKTNKLRGGYIRDVHLSGFTGGGVEREAIFVILNYNNQVGTRPVDVRDITVSGMALNGARRAVWLDGLETDPIRDVHIRDSHFTNVTNPTNTVNHTEGLRFTNVTVNGAPL
ncbi:glycoside hydrolase family 28 protein [Actinophytocola sp.]|uniref:glycoside hydrolase family 28 protein n=1 Tax=Actinophytocola sp. TaxID=1872138 RepID=UPI002ED45046